MAEFHNYTPEERRRMREERAMEREQARIAREARAAGGAARSRFASVPAKWYPRGGKVIKMTDREGGESIDIRGGMYYAGCNMRLGGLPSPQVGEPSLIDPSVAGAGGSAIRLLPEGRRGEVPRTERFSSFRSMTPEQRGEYLRFLSGRRSDASDIGYAFLYLCGLERRLIVDARKPGEVPDEERRAVSREVIRLLRRFGASSESFALYAACLALYDGTAAAELSDADFVALFTGDPRLYDAPSPESARGRGGRPPVDILARRRKQVGGGIGDNVDAYLHMLLARAAERGIAPFSAARGGEGGAQALSARLVDDLVEYARVRPFRDGGQHLGYSEGALYTKDGMSARKLLRMRLRRSSLAEGLSTLDHRPVTSLGRRPSRPAYSPSSQPIRQSGMASLDGRVPDIDASGLPMREASDLSAMCMSEVLAYRQILENRSLRGLDGVAPDVISVMTPPRGLAEISRGKGGATREVPAEVLAGDAAACLGLAAPDARKATLPSPAQAAYMALGAAAALQLVLPDALPQRLGKLMRIGAGDPVVAFRRGLSCEAATGAACLAPLFPGDAGRPILPIGDQNAASMMAGVVLAWVASQVGGEAVTDDEAMAAFSQMRFRVGARRDPALRRRRRLALYAILRATLSCRLSQTALREALSACGLAAAKPLVFQWCEGRYGQLLPHDALVVLEKLYQRADVDKGLVLYDYHAFLSGDRGRAAAASGFAIDDERLMETIRDTSGVHSILNDALSAAGDDGQDDDEEWEGTDEGLIAVDDADIDGEASDDAGGADGGDGPSGGMPPAPAAPPAPSRAAAATEAIRALYAGEGADELPTARVVDALMAALGLATTAEAMGALAEANAMAEAGSGDPLVDVDGAVAYLNE